MPTSPDPGALYAERVVRALGARCVVLFGSRADGRPHRWSDWDVAVVSEAFEGMSRRDRAGRLLDLADGLPEIDPVGFTLREFESLRHVLVWEILDRGRPLEGAATFAAVRLRFDALVSEGALQRIPAGWRFDRAAIEGAGDRNDHLREGEGAGSAR